MFGLGITEVLFIVAIGLLVVGPEKLPAFIKKIAEVITKFRRMWNQVQYEVQQEVATIVDKEDKLKITNGMKDLRNIANSSQFSLENVLGNEVKDIKKELTQVIDSVKKNTSKKAKNIKKLPKKNNDF